MKRIYLDRESFCMGDDMEDHSSFIDVSDDCSYLGVTEAVIKARYLPTYTTTWLLCSEKKGFIAAFCNAPRGCDRPTVLWQQGFDGTDKIGDDVSFFFDWRPLKRELWKYPAQHALFVAETKAKYRIGDELYAQIEAQMTDIS